MKDKLKPVLLAIVIAAVIQGITYLIPDYTQEEFIGEKEISVNYERYLEALPFQLSISDREAIISLFKDVEQFYKTNDKETISERLETIEDILDTYWYSEDFLSTLVEVDIDENFLVYEDAINLKDFRDNILNTEKTKDKEELFNEIGLFYEKYYAALNRLYSDYQGEISDNMLLALEKRDDKVIKLNQPLISKPDYDFETFLFSRVFSMSSQDYTDLYDDFVKAEATGNVDSIESMHNKMKKYWFEQHVKDMMIPMETYRNGLFTSFTDDEKALMEQQYEKFEDEKEDVSHLLDHCIDFNELVIQAQKRLFSTYYKSFDLNMFLESEETNEL